MQTKIAIRFFIFASIIVGLTLVSLFFFTIVDRNKQLVLPSAKKSSLAPTIEKKAGKIFSSKNDFTFSYGEQYVVSEAPIEEYTSIDEAEKDMNNFITLYTAELEKDTEPGALIPVGGTKLRIWVHRRFNKTLDEWIQEFEEKEKLSIIDLTDQTIAGRRIARIIFDDKNKVEYGGAYFMIENGHAVKIDILPDQPNILWHFDSPAREVEQILTSFNLGKF